LDSAYWEPTAAFFMSPSLLSLIRWHGQIAMAYTTLQRTIW